MIGLTSFPTAIPPPIETLSCRKLHKLHFRNEIKGLKAKNLHLPYTKTTQTPLETTLPADLETEMSSWGSLIAEEIDRQARQDAAECDEMPNGSNPPKNRNAAFSACRKGSGAPSWMLRPEQQPNGDGVDDWRAWMLDRYRRKVASGHYEDHKNALVDVWSEAELAWRMRHGTAIDHASCAGCIESITPGVRVITVIDGARVHASYECLEAYADRCQRDAREALVAIGLKPPPSA